MVHFIEEIKRKTTNTNFSTDVLQKIIKKKVDKQVYKNLEIQVLIHVDHTIEDIIKFFINNYCCPRRLTEDLTEYHRRIGTTKDCFINDNHKNLNMAKMEDIIKLIQLHLIGLNSIIKAKVLYEEYMGNLDLVFKNSLLNYITLLMWQKVFYLIHFAMN